MHKSGLPSLCTPKGQAREASSGSKVRIVWVQKWEIPTLKNGSSFCFLFMFSGRAEAWRHNQSWDLFNSCKTFWVELALPSMFLSPFFPSSFLLLSPHTCFHPLLFFLLKFFSLFNQYFANFFSLLDRGFIWPLLPPQLAGLWVRFASHLSTEVLRDRGRARYLRSQREGVS